MLRNRGFTHADSYLLVRQVVTPGLARELREDTPREARMKKLLGKKTIERVNHAKLIDGTKENVRDVMRAIDAVDPLAKEHNARGYTEKVTLDYENPNATVTVEMAFRTQEDKRAINLLIKGVGADKADVDGELEFRVFGEDDIRIPEFRGAIFDTSFIPMELLPMDEHLVEFYDFTSRVANAVILAQSEGTLVVHGPSENIARYQASTS